MINQNLPLEQLKRILVSVLNEYINSRNNTFTTWLFRNESLTDERVKLAKATIGELMKQTSYEGLLNVIEEKKLDNADLSNEYRVKHNNHFSRVHGSLTNNSGLADAFHQMNTIVLRTQENALPKPR